MYNTSLYNVKLNIIKRHNIQFRTFKNNTIILFLLYCIKLSCFIKIWDFIYKLNKCLKKSIVNIYAIVRWIA